MALVNGPDAQVLYLHEELRSWQQRGVAFVLANDGTLSILTESREEMRAAQRYRSDHADALRRYLAFVGGRDPDDAMRHLEAVWHSRGEFWRNEKVVAMSEEPAEYIPHKVAPLEREKSGLLRMLDANKREGDELRSKLTEVNNRIAETMGEGATGG